MTNPFKIQLERVHKAFYAKPMTMKEADRLTGIMRENICRHCRSLRLAGRLFAIRKRRCSVTGYPHVTEWTTNPNLAPKSNQLKLF